MSAMGMIVDWSHNVKQVCFTIVFTLATVTIEWGILNGVCVHMLEQDGEISDHTKGTYVHINCMSVVDCRKDSGVVVCSHSPA